MYLKLCGDSKLGRCKVEGVVKCDKDDKGEDHGIVSDDASNLRIRHFDNVFEVRTDLPWWGKRVCT